MSLIFKRVRIVKLVNGYYLKCSCNFYTHIGTCCVHIAVTIDEITVQLWHAMHAKSCNFHHLREGTSDQSNQMYEDLVFTNSPPRAHWDNIPSSNNCPQISSNLVNSSSFTDVLKSEWPIVLNWTFELSEKAINC